MPKRTQRGRPPKPKIIVQSPRPYATIDALRDSYTGVNIDPEQFYSLTEIFKKDLLCGLVKRHMMNSFYSSDMTKGRFIKAYNFDEETRNQLKIKGPKTKNPSYCRVYIKGEDLLKYLYNNLTPYILYVLESRNRMKDLFLIKTGACNI